MTSNDNNLLFTLAEISQRVSTFVSESTKSKTIHDESTLLSAIINHLTTTQSASEANAFRLSYDRLVHCVNILKDINLATKLIIRDLLQMEPKSRTAMIAFLFFMADSKKHGSSACINPKTVGLLMSGGRNFFSNKITSSESYQNVPTTSFIPNVCEVVSCLCIISA